MEFVERTDERTLRFGPTSQKILVLLLGGASLALSGSPLHYFRVIESVNKDLKRINRYVLHRNIKKLYKSRLIDAKDNDDGSTTIVLTNQGKKRALAYQLDEIRIKPMKKWDKKWRIALFDIPEQHKKTRDALARLFIKMGFYNFQKSVFVCPFECSDEFDFVVEFFNLRPYVRYVLAEHIDNELHLKQHFDLL